MPWLKQIGLALSLAATMTGCAVWLFVGATVAWESLPPRWLGDDDILWFVLPLGGSLGLATWLRWRRRAWPHALGPIACSLFAVAILRTLSLETPEGMAGLGVAIGKMIAYAFALVAAATGVVSLLLATVVVFALWLSESTVARAWRTIPRRSVRRAP